MKIEVTHSTDPSYDEFCHMWVHDTQASLAQWNALEQVVFAKGQDIQAYYETAVFRTIDMAENDRRSMARRKIRRYYRWCVR